MQEDGGNLGKSDHCILNMELHLKINKVSSNPKRPNWSKADTQVSKNFWKKRSGNTSSGAKTQKNVGRVLRR